MGSRSQGEGYNKANNESIRCLNMQAIPSAGDFLRHADIIEGTGEGEVRSQGSLKPIRR